MKHGDIVRVKGRIGVALYIPPEGIRECINALRPGLYVLCAYYAYTPWGKTTKRNSPLDWRSYGKILSGPLGTDRYAVIGRINKNSPMHLLGI